jgi:hypothetical protein
MIKAPPNKVLRAYLCDINPFCRGLIRRVLIDEFGLVLTEGWSNLQSSYPIKVIGEPLDRNEIGWGDWWEKRGWDNPAWAWMHMRAQPRFTPCYTRVDEDGSIAVFAA